MRSNASPSGTVDEVAGVASAATVDPSAWYVLVNHNSGKAVEVTGRSTADGAVVVQ